jgi:hypothetical protein
MIIIDTPPALEVLPVVKTLRVRGHQGRGELNLKKNQGISFGVGGQGAGGISLLLIVWWVADQARRWSSDTTTDTSLESFHLMQAALLPGKVQALGDIELRCA